MDRILFPHFDVPQHRSMFLVVFQCLKSQIDIRNTFQTITHIYQQQVKKNTKILMNMARARVCRKRLITMEVIRS